MYLIMVVEGIGVAKKSFLHCDKLSQLISELKKEYPVKGQEPKFYLVNVPSAINTFKSLSAHNNGENRVG